jgi:hypothetical protein
MDSLPNRLAAPVVLLHLLPQILMRRLFQQMLMRRLRPQIPMSVWMLRDGMMLKEKAVTSMRWIFLSVSYLAHAVRMRDTLPMRLAVFVAVA